MILNKIHLFRTPQYVIFQKDIGPLLVNDNNITI
jgi:hypothetical protein